jgi:hypothetical protein
MAIAKLTEIGDNELNIGGMIGCRSGTEDLDNAPTIGSVANNRDGQMHQHRQNCIVYG